ncbi:MAG: hypothetical protein WDN28_05970 [Chthoniobacter sp.]
MDLEFFPGVVEAIDIKLDRQAERAAVLFIKRTKFTEGLIHPENATGRTGLAQDARRIEQRAKRFDMLR